MKNIICLLTCASLICPSTFYADDEDEYEDFNPLEYSYQYSTDPKTDFRGYYRQNPNQNDCDDSGYCYFNSCRAAQLTVGVALGVAMVVAIIAVVSQDGNSSHCH